MNSMSEEEFELSDDSIDGEKDPRRRALIRLDELAVTFPRGTFIDTMTDEDLHRIRGERKDV